MPAPKPLPDMSAAAVAPLGQVGDYKLLTKLGEGGMGLVYRALHTQMERVVAVKILPPKLLGDTDAVRRFKKEAVAAARLQHPHIVHAYDARDIDGTYILAMEYLEGMDLADLVRKSGPLPVADACELVRQAALGLQCAHENKLVHRDVKPSNLMLSWASRGREPTDSATDPPTNQPAHAGRSPTASIKLLDLGLARPSVASATGESLTKSGMIVGTPDYIAPEQINNSRDVDIRADIYGLGCSFFYLLTGQPPFAGPEHSTVYEKLKAHVEQPPSDIRELRREAPSKLGDVIRRMMAKRPQDRFATPAEVAAAVQRFTAGCDPARLLAQAQEAHDSPAAVPGRGAAVAAWDRDTGGAADPTRQNQPRKALAHPRKLWWGLTALGLALLLAAATWFVVSQPGDNGEGAGDAVADAGSEDSPSDNGGTESSDGDALQEPTPSGNARAEESSDWIVLSWTPDEETRHAVWLFSPDGRDQLQVTRDPGMIDSEPVFSPDGRRLAFTRADQSLRRSGIWVCDVAGSRLREIAAPQGQTERLMSPIWLTNRQLAYTRDPEFDASTDIEFRQAEVPDHLDSDDKLPQSGLLFSFLDGFGDRSGLITDANPTRDQFVGLIQPAGQRGAADIFVSNLGGDTWKTIWADEVEDRRDSRALWSPDGRWIAWQRQFTPATQLRGIQVGIGLAELDDDGQWNTSLQPQSAGLTLPVAWTPDGQGLLCARIVGSPGRLPQAAFFLMARDFRIIRPLFELPGGLTIARQRHGGRLGDWALVPGDAPLPPSARRPL